MCSEKEQEVLAQVVLESCRKDCVLLRQQESEEWPCTSRLSLSHRVEMIRGLVVLSALSRKQLGPRRGVGSS